MKIAVFGTGMVGQEIATRLIANNHEVMMGARSATNEKAQQWVANMGHNAYQGTFKDAANFTDEIIFNCTNGEHALNVLASVGATDLTNKILIDISNPLDFSNGMPPTLSICNDNSLGETIQKTYPKTKVVKALNTMNCYIMLNPKKISGKHDAFLSGNDDAAKQTVRNLLNTFGWSNENILDLGDISTARGTEMLLPIWLRIYGKLGHADFNFHIQQNSIA